MFLRKLFFLNVFVGLLDFHDDGGVGGWVDGWVAGWRDEWVDGRAKANAKLSALNMLKQKTTVCFVWLK